MSWEKCPDRYVFRFCVASHGEIFSISTLYFKRYSYRTTHTLITGIAIYTIAHCDECVCVCVCVCVSLSVQVDNEDTGHDLLSSITSLSIHYQVSLTHSLSLCSLTLCFPGTMAGDYSLHDINNDSL